MINAFSPIDIAAFVWFLAMWFGQAWLTEKSPWAKHSLTHFINIGRHGWVRQASTRDLRMVDTAIVAGLQNGTAFFASTSLLAIGGGFTLLNSVDHAVGVVSALSDLTATDRTAFEYKVIGLLAIYAYAFFKFGWAYRMFNFGSILLGALPPPVQSGTVEMDKAVARASSIIVVAGTNFNRGLRAFFMSIGYLGCFLGPLPLVLSSTFIAVVLARRQFTSNAVKAMRRYE
ncbi:DUF599 domain-containing protein [Pleomorphomonas koreensis]|uniref:DUF599 domain-containing protein n=1 Tax=Pleomorphomonas koreensis TaxID=257440 RepID=UPI0003FDEECF|nr:DUF599 family protein [Pleomorphomonas koreensis]